MTFPINQKKILCQLLCQLIEGGDIDGMMDTSKKGIVQYR